MIRVIGLPQELLQQVRERLAQNTGYEQYAWGGIQQAQPRGRPDEPPCDLVEVEGCWMTPEEAKVRKLKALFKPWK